MQVRACFDLPCSEWTGRNQWWGLTPFINDSSTFIAHKSCDHIHADSPIIAYIHEQETESAVGAARMRTSHLLPSHAAHALQHICHSFRLISSCMLFSLHNFAAANLKERWRPTGVLWLHVTNCGTAFQFILDKPTDVNFEHGVKILCSRFPVGP